VQIADFCSKFSRSADGQHFVQVNVHCVGENVKELDVISHLQHARYINLMENRIKSVTALANLPHALEVSLASNEIEEVEVLGQEGVLVHCVTLDLSNNDIADLGTPLLPKCQVLNVSSNQLTSLEGIAVMGSLQEADFSSNRITTLEVDGDSAGLQAVEVLNLSNNQIASLSGIAKATAVKTLNLAQNQVAALGELKHLATLSVTDVDLRDNPIIEEPGADPVRTELLILNPGITRMNGEEITEDDREAAKTEIQAREEARLAALQELKEKVLAFIEKHDPGLKEDELSFNEYWSGMGETEESVNFHLKLKYGKDLTTPDAEE